MKMIFIRHGDPDYSIDSLTEKGFVEAELLSERISKLDIKDIYCSPLGRARRTAEPTLKKMNRKAEILDWLMEFPGYIIDPVTKKKRIPWDHLPSYWTNCPELYDKDRFLDNEVMNSGDVREKYTEVCVKLDALMAKYGYERNGSVYKVTNENTDTVVLFCHFGIECVMLSHILGVSPLVLWQGFIALPSSVTTLVSEEREEGTAYFRCLGFGDISHLNAAGEEPSFSGRFCETFSNKDERH
ncbi:MAG: histidine phosphatase family protein [Clostridia bacterium]|nr:histidine phosphatase family protein [Clostridia bacterium]